MSEIVIIEDSDEEALDKQTGQHSKRGQAHELSEIERDKVRGTEQENQLLSEPVTVKRSFPEEIDSAEKAGSSKRQVLQNLRIPSFSGANEQDIVDLESLEHRRESNHQASDSNSGDQAWIAPFQLFRAQGIPDYANRYALEKILSRSSSSWSFLAPDLYRFEKRRSAKLEVVHHLYFMGES